MGLQTAGMSESWLQATLREISTSEASSKEKWGRQKLAFDTDRWFASAKRGNGSDPIDDLDDVLAAASKAGGKAFAKAYPLQATLASKGHRLLAKQVKEFARGRHIRIHPEVKRELISQIIKCLEVNAQTEAASSTCGGDLRDALPVCVGGIGGSSDHSSLGEQRDGTHGDLVDGSV